MGMPKYKQPTAPSIPKPPPPVRKPPRLTDKDVQGQGEVDAMDRARRISRNKTLLDQENKKGAKAVGNRTLLGGL